ALAASPSVAAAARAAGVTRAGAYRRRESDPDFAAAWDEALEASTDALVAEMYRRAVEGTERPLLYKGQVVAHVREFSDQLAMFLARAHGPKVYRDKLDQFTESPLRIEVRYEEMVRKIYGEGSVLSDAELESLGGIAAKLADGDPKPDASSALSSPRRP